MEKINIDDLTIGQAKALVKMIAGPVAEQVTTAVVPDASPWEIGAHYLIRTVTMHLSGTLIWIGEKELMIDNASWIADSGRFHKALIDPRNVFEEVEPFKEPVIVGRGAVVDATKIPECVTEVK